MYKGSKTRVRCGADKSEWFDVRVGSSGLSVEPSAVHYGDGGSDTKHKRRSIGFYCQM